jgi:catechol 2,3-dioxygenase-like lactoylglutathione lyase family enzyme
VAIKTADWDASIRFYMDVLGFQKKTAWGSNGSRGIWLDGGDGIYLEVFEDIAYRPEPKGSIAHLALKTDDCDSLVERARSAGARITMEPRDLVVPSIPPTPVRIAFCEGPEGAVIEFVQLGIPSSS